MKIEQLIKEQYNDVNEKTIVHPLKNNETNLQNLFPIEKFIKDHFQRRNLSTDQDGYFEVLLETELKKIPHYTHEEITYFSSRIPEIVSLDVISTMSSSILSDGYKKNHLGILLTKLVQYHYNKLPTNKPYVLLLQEYGEKVPMLGSKLAGPHMHIFGDCGSNVAREMEQGILEIDGSVKNFCGQRMKGGTIKINGNAGDALADCMKGGNIILSGNAEDYTADLMENGIIFISGSVKNNLAQKMSGGNITIQKNAGDYVGSQMHRGHIIIYGNCGKEPGADMTSGKIIVYGKAGKITKHREKEGMLYVNHRKRLRRNGLEE